MPWAFRLSTRDHVVCCIKLLGGDAFHLETAPGALCSPVTVQTEKELLITPSVLPPFSLERVWLPEHCVSCPTTVLGNDAGQGLWCPCLRFSWWKTKIVISILPLYRSWGSWRKALYRYCLKLKTALKGLSWFKYINRCSCKEWFMSIHYIPQEGVGRILGLFFQSIR